MDDKQKYIQKLEEISKISIEEAKKRILEEAQDEVREEVASRIREGEEEAKLTANKKSQEILADALKHGALNIIPEYTVSAIRISDEEVKGRIIGKEGRNIRAFNKNAA